MSRFARTEITSFSLPNLHCDITRGKGQNSNGRSNSVSCGFPKDEMQAAMYSRWCRWEETEMLKGNGPNRSSALNVLSLMGR